MVEIACASSRTSPSKLEGVAEGRGRVFCRRPSTDFKELRELRGFKEKYIYCSPKLGELAHSD